jgi:hypothetical protein
VADEGPITWTKWSPLQLTFTVVDIKLVSFPHTDAMVIMAHIDKWDITRVLVENGSQAEIIFQSALDQMGYDRKQLNKAMKPPLWLRGGGGRIEPVSSISLPISFESLRNARAQFVTFDVVDMHYPYNVIFSRGLLNIFEAALHSTYLYLKVPASLGVISVHDSQKDAKNIEQGFTPGYINVNCL